MQNQTQLKLEELRILAKEVQMYCQHTDIVSFCYMTNNPEEIFNHLKFYIDNYCK